MKMITLLLTIVALCPAIFATEFSYDEQLDQLLDDYNSKVSELNNSYKAQLEQIEIEWETDKAILKNNRDEILADYELKKEEIINNPEDCHAEKNGELYGLKGYRNQQLFDWGLNYLAEQKEAMSIKYSTWANLDESYEEQYQLIYSDFQESLQKLQQDIMDAGEEYELVIPTLRMPSLHQRLK
ncbi:MAG: hypothetical protein ATN36_04660 [Epulopiscium sp. Nele67-Bin005]|nr:MAG: hypothetical protein ATN36_04660 [Epulopiscium sp. Nele67-Bin005]